MRRRATKLRFLVEAAPDADLIVDRVADAVGVAESVPGQRGTHWAVGRFFEELARRRPLVVVFDDIHWGEPTFLDLVEAIDRGRRPTRRSCCSAWRGRTCSSSARTGARESRSASRLSLAPLSDDAAEQLIGEPPRRVCAYAQTCAAASPR